MAKTTRSHSKKPKKAYKTPTVRSYGDIRKITQTTGGLGTTRDGAQSKPRKTGL